MVGELSKQMQNNQCLAVDLVEGVAQGRDDGGDQGGCLGVEHGGVVAGQETLDEGQGVNIIVAAKAELYPGDQFQHVGDQGARQDQDQLSHQGEVYEPAAEQLGPPQHPSC